MNERMVDIDRSTVAAFLARLAMALLALGSVLWGAFCRRPWDALGLAAGAIAMVAILVNALFLQASPHPAPMLPGKLRPVALGVKASAQPDDAPLRAIIRSAPPPPPAQPPASSALAPRPAAASRGAAAKPAASSRRVLAVQRALADFGYGQVKPSGLLGAETRTAIERFERERKLPVTGQISDRLTRELAAVTGRPLE